MKYRVEWEKWVFDAASAEIVAIHYCSEFTIEAAYLEEAVGVAEREAPKELDKRREELSGGLSHEFVPGFNYMAHVIGLKDEKGVYHKLHDSSEVFHGRIRKSSDYGGTD